MNARKFGLTWSFSPSPFWTGANLTTDQANYDGNYPYAGHPRGKSRETTVAVRTFDPNPLGLYEVHGNVFEWVHDRYGGAYSDGPVTDPTGLEQSSSRVTVGAAGTTAHAIAAQRFATRLRRPSTSTTLVFVS